MIGELKDLIDPHRGIAVLTAARAMETLRPSPAPGRGAFASAFVQGLTQTKKGQEAGAQVLLADENGDGVVTLDELGDYLRTEVARETKGLQHPALHRGLVPSFPIASRR